MANPDTPEQPSKQALFYLSAWGNSSVSPAGLATLVAPLHYRPLQVFPLLFAPMLLFSSYANLQGFKKDSAGMTCALSGTYTLLAVRRSQGSLRSKFRVRGAVRGAAIGLGLINVVACGWVYASVDRKKESEERRNNPRWVE